MPSELATADSGGTRSGWQRAALLLWAVIAAVTFFGGTLAENAGLPAPHLITGLVAGLVIALTGIGKRVGVVLPRVVSIAGQAIAGVLLGRGHASRPLSGQVLTTTCTSHCRWGGRQRGLLCRQV